MNFNWKNYKNYSTRQYGLCSQIIYVGEVQLYQLRNAENFMLRKANTAAIKKSLYYPIYRPTYAHGINDCTVNYKLACH